MGATPVLRRYNCGFWDLPASFDGCTVAHLSDLHSRVPPALLPELRRCQPEMLVITGDLIDSHHPDAQGVLAFLEAARCLCPCFYVPGNHESRLPQYPAIAKELERRGVTLLENDSVSFFRKGDRIQLLGVTDRDFPGGEPRFRQDLEALAKTEGFRLLLSHRPEYFPLYAHNRIQLTLCGHAHGGQIRVPGIGGLFAPGQGFFPKYDGGVYRSGDSTMVVSRGLCNTAMIPRFLNPTELLLLTLRVQK